MSSILLNASRNTKEEERSKYFKENGVNLRPVNISLVNSKDQDTSVDRVRSVKRVRIDVEDDEVHNNNSNNLAKMLFGSKNRSEAIKKQRSSVDKDNLEQALGNSRVPSRSEDNKQRPPPTVTVTSKNSSRLAPMDKDVHPIDSKTSSKNRLVPGGPFNGVLAVPAARASADPGSSVRKNIIRTKIVNKVDDILNKELVSHLYSGHYS